MSARTWSAQQERIFTALVAFLHHIIVRARAGCGKTTTIVEAVKRFCQAHPGKRVVVCAFNKKIAEELVTRFAGFGVDVKTLHSIGCAIVMRAWSGIRIEGKETKGNRAKALTQAVCGDRVPDAIKKLVTRLHSLGREIAPHAKRLGDLTDILINFECEPDDEWVEAGFDNNFIEERALEAMELAASKRPLEIDFSDMIFLPVRNRWMHKYADLVVVDEAQDMTTAQLEIAQGICKGKICIVGDDRQAIYGFRGADAGSLDRLKAELGADEYGLTKTYRCGKVIGLFAAEIVPDFETGDSNPEGLIYGLNTDKLADEVALGDFLLSRSTAPLVATAMSFLRAGKRTRIAGRQIGDDLIHLVKRLTKSARSVPEFLERLEGWSEKEMVRASKGKTAEQAQARHDEILDKVETLRNIADGARSVADIIERLEALFTDDGLGQAGVITCSTVHRAKGLEASRVFILAETLKDHNIEEQNIRYVAITRAKDTLVMVGQGFSALAFDRQAREVCVA